ncbi:ParB/RepB/Spo0J family partition protein [Hominenteromicrobium sp.]|uniref:ParB/RepB/Spo0J family partition protein n=1 Tax=Hominenteromicrobium sp. TaxID=3073581 RepID=UPI00399B796C
MAFTEKKRLLELSPDKIVPNPAQPRLDFPQDELLQLAESIRQNGVLQPILVRRDRDRYILVAGERRWRASRMAGLKTIPAIVQELSPQDGAVLALIENMQRSDLNFFSQIASSSWTPSGRKLGLPQPLRLRKQCQGMLQRVLLECSTPDSSSEGC